MPAQSGRRAARLSSSPSPQPFFPAVEKNGVVTDSWGEGMGFEVALRGGEPGAIAATTPASSDGMTLDICPIDYSSFPENAPPLTCGCSAKR